MRFTRTILAGATALVLLAGPALAQQGPGQGGGPGQGRGQNMGNGNGHGMGNGNGHGMDNGHGGPGPQGGGNHLGGGGPGPQAHFGGPNGRPWARGDHFDGRRQVVGRGDWNHYHLHPPPRGYEWVYSGNQFVMVAIATGIIASIVADSAYGY